MTTSPRSILVIEDNEQNRYLVTFLLERHGFQVEAAEDGVRGVAAARTRRPDLILLDIQLPGMDGYAVARALRALEELRRVPIVALTSYAMPGDREKAWRRASRGTWRSRSIPIASSTISGGRCAEASRSPPSRDTIPRGGLPRPKGDVWASRAS
jgi:two-component system cell cycle response regulator DivK